MTVNRLGGSGLQAVVSAAQLIRLGEAEVVLAAGTESMSQQPHIIRRTRWGLRFREGRLEDNLWLALTDEYNDLPMAVTVENLASGHGISRKEADDFAYVSHMRAAAAQQRGYFANEVVPVSTSSRGESSSSFTISWPRRAVDGQCTRRSDSPCWYSRTLWSS